MRTARAVAVAALILLPIVGCSGESTESADRASGANIDPSTSASPSSSTSSIATSTTGSAPPTVASTVVATQPPASAAPLDDVIVKLDDLPAGWSAQEDSGEDAGDDCLSAAFDAAGVGDDAAQEEAQAGFAQSDFGPFLSFGVSRGLPSPDLIALVSLATQCSGQEVAGGGIYEVSDVSFGDIGDETVAFRADITDGPIPVTMVVALARVGDDIVFGSTVATFGAPEAALLEQGMILMAERLTPA